MDVNGCKSQFIIHWGKVNRHQHVVRLWVWVYKSDPAYVVLCFFGGNKAYFEPIRK